jgi:hypothetical protein
MDIFRKLLPPLLQASQIADPESGSSDHSISRFPPVSLGKCRDSTVTSSIPNSQLDAGRGGGLSPYSLRF